ncbi:MAG TPA: hypothetical protein VJP59_05975 [Gemmatimonadota bacterium]|nr:hypothetical protein [Gemmatimonadota bacterium]
MMTKAQFRKERRYWLAGYIVLAVAVIVALWLIEREQDNLCHFQQVSRSNQIEAGAQQAKSLALTILANDLSNAGVTDSSRGRQLVDAEAYLDGPPPKDPPPSLSRPSAQLVVLGRIYMQNSRDRVAKLIPEVHC